MSSDTGPSLAQQIIRAITVFQAIVIVPVALLHGVIAFFGLLIPISTWGAFWILLQEIIIFLAYTSIPIIVILQWRNTYTASTALKLEACKSSLVTGLWVWWVVRMSGTGVAKTVALNGVAYAVVIVLLFYPSLINSFLQYRQVKKSEYQDREGTIELCDHYGDRREENDVLLGSVD
ncbi:hypothetical protein K491DRAFT_754196 [Lophiostoma macrostomum CBS 122681]|uniref:MARVEL domain-containing protein n=1 Tax=Lophiostoma macrostomum CBS 122681 TaxID=1314788 RepID=A0A6A6TQR7_9PLEO|nr:hypothetical protein K491DRAFT_754196 [Lophiostoma macrostomum CBS 122681]